ncbi:MULTISPECIES: FadR/GntR family transcriptional regulator [unclassified Streptomyces]|uniref:FadR/GntR family transcriptional regulator n=1 Tax=unclassified Streptomyces TaxID=2593676 RepID=UPI002237C6E6|nr:FadR/GntR family transcriptional regulator [Streptomyces sp. SHP 1-2]MCW5249555.1 FadR family transcriptional regulator [Streptomyces sp. SHP 1-2]
MTTASNGNRGPKADLFSPVSMSRVSQVIVDQVKVLIRDGELSPGDRLPSERDLCEQFGVSRVTIREALRVLEASGLVTVRVGARGGAFVTSPSTERLGEGLADLLSLSPLTASDVTEARMIVETGALPLIIERATEEDIAELMRLTDEGRAALAAGTYDMQMSAAFHVRLAECAHNPALTMLIHSFHGPMLMSLREAKVSAPLMGKKGGDEHRELVLAIQRRDLAGAERIMKAHLERTASRVDG